MRLVVESLARSLPGLGSIALLLTIFFYVFAVVATKLFSSEFSQWFVHLGASLFSLLAHADAEQPPSSSEIQALRPDIVALRSELRSLQRKTGT